MHNESRALGVQLAAPMTTVWPTCTAARGAEAGPSWGYVTPICCLMESSVCMTLTCSAARHHMYRHQASTGELASCWCS